ncbi:MAG: magnesium transporter [Spirochaetia bacterium]|nr:magnesium transporter [Spirochaetia bacterium]
MLDSSHQYFFISEENQDRFVSVLKKLIERKKTKWLKRILEQIHSTALARLWPFLSDVEQNIIIGLLNPEASAELLPELSETERSELLKTKNTEWIVNRLEELESDDIVDILKGLETWEAKSIIRRFKKDYSQKIKELLKYPEETAGALMTSDFMAVLESATIETIIRQFRKVIEKDEVEDLHLVFVVNKQNQLLGYIPLRKLILEKPKKEAREIMSPPIITVRPDLDQEEVAKIFRHYDLISLPVVDERNTILGRITVDDIVDVMQDEASEDVYRMVGLAKEENITNKISTSLKHRFPWMLINLVTTSLAAFVVSLYQGVIKEYIILAAFMPIIAALGGATGNQMVAMIVRGLATGDLYWKRINWILFREVISVIIGSSVIGAIIGLAAWKLEGSYILGLIVFFSLLLNMIFATLAGAGVPLMLKLLRQDPAWGSSVLVSAITDMMGFFIFLGLASYYLIS